MPPNPRQDLTTSETRIKAVEAAYLEAARGGDERAIGAIRQYFAWINERLRSVETAAPGRGTEARRRAADVCRDGRIGGRSPRPTVTISSPTTVAP